MRLLLFIAISLSLVTGCWDNVDLKDRILVLGLGVDLDEEDRFALCLQFDIPAPGGNQDAEHEAGVICGTGNSPSTALSSIQSRLPREIFLGQLQAVVLGQDLATQPMMVATVIDDLLRNPFVDNKAFLTVAYGRADDVLTTRTPLESSPARFIAEAHDRVRFDVMNPRTELWQFLRALETPGWAPMASGVKAGPDQIELSGVALFDRYELAGWLGTFETRGLMWLMGKGHGTTVTITTDQGQADISITGVRMRSQPGDGAGLRVKKDLSVAGNLVVKPDGIGIIEESDFLEMEQSLARTIAAEAEQAILLMQHYNSDAAGIGRQIYYRRPALWQRLDWARDFALTRVDVEVRARINRQGMLN